MLGMLQLVFTVMILGATANIRGDPTPLFSFRADASTTESHLEFGKAVGTRFGQQIRSRVAGSWKTYSHRPH
jgi:hypothetical protein